MWSIRRRLLTITFGTAVASSILIVSVLAIAYYVQPPRERLSSALLDVVLAWYAHELPSPPRDTLQGYIAGPDGRIVYVVNDPTTACQPPSLLSFCIDDVESIPEAGHPVERGGATWYEYRALLPDAHVVIARAQPRLIDDVANSVAAVTVVVALTSIVAAPIAVLLSLATVRPIVRRLRAFADASRAFAAGDMAARTHEQTSDELGMVGQQFDQMATTISRQLGELRSLAAENTRLSNLVEQNARQTERAIFARDLHDTISQHLFSLAMGTAPLADVIARDPQRARQQAAQLAVIAEEAQQELRTILAQLRPVTVAGQSLAEHLDAYVQHWQARSGIATDVRLQLDVLSIPTAVEHVVFRVCQESLNNVVRHAAAQQVVITLRQQAAQVQLVIADDGCGFDPAMQASGVGLIGMRERVRAVGGTLMLQSSPAAGTTVAVRVPIAPGVLEGGSRADHTDGGG